MFKNTKSVVLFKLMKVSESIELTLIWNRERNRCKSIKAFVSFFLCLLVLF